LYFPFYGYLQISPVLILVIFTFPLSLIAIINQLPKFEIENFFLIYILIFISTYLCFFTQGSITQISIIAIIPLMFSLRDDLLNILKTNFQRLLILSLIGYVLFLMGFSLNNNFTNSEREYFTNFLTISHYPNASLLNPNTFRFYGFFNEPGHLACFCLIFLAFDGFKFKNNFFIWLSAVLSFSTAFFFIAPFYIIYFHKKKLLRYIVPIIITSISIVYILNSYNGNTLIELITYKAFAYTDYNYAQDGRINYSIEYQDNFSEILFGIENSREVNLSSFFSVLRSAGIFGFLLYLISLIIIPKRFLFMFVMFTLFRYNLIFNYVFLISIITIYSQKTTNIRTYQKKIFA